MTKRFIVRILLAAGAIRLLVSLAALVRGYWSSARVGSYVALQTDLDAVVVTVLIAGLLLSAWMSVRNRSRQATH